MKKFVKEYVLFIALIITITSGCSIKRNTISGNRKAQKTAIDSAKFKFALIEGEKQFILGNYDLAKEYMHECIKFNNKSSVPYYNLAKIEYNRKNLKDARVYLDSAIQKDYTNKWYFKLKTQICIEQNDITSAINSTKELIELEKSKIENRLYLADLYLNTQKYNEALKVYQEMEDLVGYNENFILEKIKLYDVLRENDKAKSELLRLIEINPTNAYYYGLLAEFYVEDIEYEKALEAYEKVQELEPSNGIIHLSMYEFYARIGEKNKALKELENAITNKQVPVENKLQALLGVTEVIRNDTIKTYQQRLVNIVSEQHPNEPRVALLKVDLLIKQNEYDEARDILLKVSDTVKSNFYIWQQLMLVENFRNDNKSLLTKSNEALMIFPNQPVFYLFNGLANYNLKNYTDAISILKSGINYVSNNKEIEKQMLTYIGESYYRENNLEVSFTYFDKVLDIDSNDTYVLNNYSYYLSLKEDKLEKAKEMMIRCISLDELNTSYLDTYAWVLFKMKDYTTSLKYIEKAYNNGGNNSAVIVEHYGDILFKNGLKNQAQDKWKEARELGSDSEVLRDKIEKGIFVEN